jgi:hypothetical protein
MIYALTYMMPYTNGSAMLGADKRRDRIEPQGMVHTNLTSAKLNTSA